MQSIGGFFHSYKGQLVAQWYVTALFDDIADFYVTIRDSGNQLLVERRMAYDDRTVQIPGAYISDNYDGQLELCVLAKNSDGTIRTWFESQCIYLPENFETIKETYGTQRSQPYLIHSLRKRIRAPIADGRSTSTKKRQSNRSAGMKNDAMKMLLLSSVVLIYFVTKFY